MKIKILIDGYYLDKPRGLGRYIQELLYALNENPPENIEINVCVPNTVSKDRINSLQNIVFHKVKKFPFPFWEQFVLPYLKRKVKADIVHTPYNTSSLLLSYSQNKTLTTIHDIMYLQKEHKVKSLYQKFGNFYRNIVVTLCNRKKNNNKNEKNYIVAVSNKTKDDVKIHFKKSSFVVYTPVDSFYNKVKDKIQPVSGRYIYHVGGTSHHKNTERVINAFNSISKNRLKLVVSGTPKECYLSKKYSSENVIFTGWIDDVTMASYYKYSTCVCFPSLREGYGLPIIEAFKFNTPLITSNIAPLDEISGNAGYLVDPTFTEEIAEAIDKINTRDDIRERYIDKGISRLKSINSKTMADEMIHIYERVYNNE